MMQRLVMAVLALVSGAAEAATFEEGLALKKQEKLAEAERVFAEVVRDAPEDTAALEQWATLLGWLGRHQESITVWQRALAQKPESPEYAMGLARVQYWKGDLPAARQGLERLLAAAPGSPDALALAGDVCAAQKDFGCARERYLAAQALAPSAELEKKLAGAEGPLRWRLDAGGQLDAYDRDRGVEGSVFLQASGQVLPPLVLSAGYEQLHQFGQTDHRVNAGLSLHPLAPLLVSARFAVSPSANTVARWEASGGVDVRVGGPVTVLTSVRHLDFPGEQVTILGGGLRLDVEQWTLTGQGGAVLSNTNDTQAFGAGKIEYAMSDAWRLYAGASRGGQAQLLFPNPVATVVVATDVVAGVTWQVDRNVGLRLDYTYESFGDVYVKHSLGSALTYKF